MSVVEAVQRDLADVRTRAAALADSAIAASALVMAEALDDTSNSATSKAMCAKALREAMDRLRELAPPDEKRDRLDEITARREARRAAS